MKSKLFFTVTKRILVKENHFEIYYIKIWNTDV
jgi:hypothetical protein